ncbi:MAG: hypothetical protein SGJ15_10200 [Bacteroidota bacterium]|nr:hypothetical protein [Bacteroidota bacterium]
MKGAIGIDIMKTRDTREISKLSFDYISKNGAAIILPVVSIAIPLIIVSYLSAVAVGETYNPFNKLVSLKKSLSPRSYLIVIALFLFYIIGLSLYNYFINNCLLKGERKAKNEESLSEGSFIDIFKMYLLNFTILFAIYYFVSNVSEYLYFQFMSDFEPGAVSGVIGYIWLLLLNKLPWLIIMPPVFFFCFSASYISHRDNIGSSDALTKIWSLVKAKSQKLWLNSIKVSGIYFGLILVLKIFIWYAGGIGSLFDHLTITFYNILTTFELIFTLTAMMHLHVSMVLLYGSFEDEEHGHFIKRKVDAL